jgi:hypothetical protein
LPVAAFASGLSFVNDRMSAWNSKKESSALADKATQQNDLRQLPQIDQAVIGIRYAILAALNEGYRPIRIEAFALTGQIDGFFWPLVY